MAVVPHQHNRIAPFGRRSNSSGPFITPSNHGVIVQRPGAGAITGRAPNEWILLPNGQRVIPPHGGHPTHVGPVGPNGRMRRPSRAQSSGPHSHVHHHQLNPGQYNGNAHYHLTNPETKMKPYQENGKNQGMTSDLAVVRIVDWLNSDKGERVATRAIISARSHIRNTNNVQAFPFDMWQTLDDGLFMGRLATAVYLNWSNEYDHTTCGQTFASGIHQLRGERVERVAILLNPKFKPATREFYTNDTDNNGEVTPQTSHGRHRRSLARPDEIVCNLIHQMIHAWFLRSVGQQKKNKEADGRLKHAEHFWKIAHSIFEISAQTDPKYSGAPPFSDTFKQMLKPLERSLGGILPRHLSGYDGDTFDRTFCSILLQNDPKEKSDVDAWYKKASGPAKDATSDNLHTFDSDTSEIKAIPRHERGSPWEYIEVIWNRQYFDYKRKGVERDFVSMKQRLANNEGTGSVASKRTIILPRNVDTPTFRAIDSFLKIGTRYLPSQDPVTIQGHMGPPILSGPLRMDEVDYIGINVKTYKVANAIAFEELASHALYRLKSQSITRSDPLPALREIYDANTYVLAGLSAGTKDLSITTFTPPSELRAWAREFMMRCSSSSTNSSEQGGTGYYGSNLHQIEVHASGGAGVQGLVSAMLSRELEQDYNLALTRLWERTPTALHPPDGVFRGGGPERLGGPPVDPAALLPTLGVPDSLIVHPSRSLTPPVRVIRGNNTPIPVPVPVPSGPGRGRGSLRLGDRNSSTVRFNLPPSRRPGSSSHAPRQLTRVPNGVLIRNPPGLPSEARARGFHRRWNELDSDDSSWDSSSSDERFPTLGRNNGRRRPVGTIQPVRRIEF